jgi:hypothetical protein
VTISIANLLRSEGRQGLLRIEPGSEHAVRRRSVVVTQMSDSSPSDRPDIPPAAQSTDTEGRNLLRSTCSTSVAITDDMQRLGDITHWRLTRR